MISPNYFVHPKKTKKTDKLSLVCFFLAIALTLWSWSTSVFWLSIAGPAQSRTFIIPYETFLLETLPSLGLVGIAIEILILLFPPIIIIGCSVKAI